MATILPFICDAGGSFDEYMTGIMGEAFDELARSFMTLGTRLSCLR